MGYDAFVRCNCYRDGKSTPSPISPRKWHLDTTDGYIREDANLTYKERRQLQDWELNGCEHPYQRYVDERVGNIWEVGEARYFLQTYFTEDEIPVLYDMLPHGNDGTFPVEKAEDALRDIAYVEEHRRKTICRLVGTLRREKGKNRFSTLYETSCADDLVVIGPCNDGCLVKFGYDGLFVQNEETQAVLFQAKRILQTALCPKDGIRQTRLEDMDHPEQQLVIDIMPIGWEIVYRKTRLPVSAFVSQLEVQFPSLENYSFAVLWVLKRLLHASLETGNPIVWC